MVAADMVATKRDALAAAVATAPSLLAVCGGYQLLGASYQLGERADRGLGLADLETVREPGERLIGNVAIEVDLGAGPRVLAGFENHGGRTYLGSGAQAARPGPARSRQQRPRRARGRASASNLIGTYLHGPLLPKNAWLADELIARAIERREGARPELEPLDDALEDAAHAGAVAAARAGAGLDRSSRPVEPKPPVAAIAESASSATSTGVSVGERRDEQLGDPVAGLDLEGAARGRC